MAKIIISKIYFIDCTFGVFLLSRLRKLMPRVSISEMNGSACPYLPSGDNVVLKGPHSEAKGAM